ncbi:kinase-like domain-containing protein [Cristinia sonorae]|uniref:Kinase-like domain-containing protein n=1 Tax=Cristinia sonorae TaxID=1940300 RepID=A0A8K0XQ67_9AGAR|nr:kinase-like domain-containing protein [Cristinia sonorae]
MAASIDILGYIDDAIPDDPHAATDASHIPDDIVPKVLDMLWEVLVDPTNHSLKGVKTNRLLPASALGRLALKLSIISNCLPTSFYLKGVTRSETQSRGAGGFADIYYGKWCGHAVALKRPRVEAYAHQSQTLQASFCRESFMWRRLRHRHVLPFLGVSEDAFHSSICMVIPWMENGNIRSYMSVLQETGKFSGQDGARLINKWMYQVVLGLVYLHEEGLIHGDLHGGNILIDDEGHVQLTDFGTGVLADATPHNYASKHGGGAYQYRAPELHDPDSFGGVDNRPTVATDVFALAMVFVELYTDETPFGETSYFKVCQDVLRKIRPPRPATGEGVLVSDSLWALIQRCWAHEPSERPTAHGVADELKTIISSEYPEDTATNSWHFDFNIYGYSTSELQVFKALTIWLKPLFTAREMDHWLSNTNVTASKEADGIRWNISSIIPSDKLQSTVDAMWEVLSPSAEAPMAVNPPTGDILQRVLPLKSLRRILFELCAVHGCLPEFFFLRGIRTLDGSSRGSGSFADLYYGEWRSSKVGIKQIRIESPGRTRKPEDREQERSICRTSLLWMNLHHPNVVEFLGMTTEPFPEILCLVVPWFENGDIRRHIAAMRQQGKMNGQSFINSVNTWLHQVALGLVYLHGEDIIHGALHGGNILINKDRNACLTDFGLDIMDEQTTRYYASKQAGGPYQYRAPELHNPSSFGLRSVKATTSSDVYAVAFVSIELYTEQVPFEGEPYFQVCKKVLDGQRPQRPRTKDGDIMPEPIWNLIQSCWAPQPAHRLSSKDVASRLGAIAAPVPNSRSAAAAKGAPTKQRKKSIIAVDKEANPPTKPMKAGDSSTKPAQKDSTPTKSAQKRGAGSKAPAARRPGCVIA